MMTDTQQAVNVMSNFVNGLGSGKYDDFAQLMSSQHRTIQQSFTKLCVAWLKQLAETEYYDLRNENSVQFAKGIKEQLDNACLPLI